MVDRSHTIFIYCSSFLLSSLFETKGVAVLDAVQRGDLQALAEQHPPSTALIVDGVFGGPLAVTGTECRNLIEAGWNLYGCSSIGALRAAELYTLGMIGLGRIYDHLRSGIILDDTELAAAYHPKTMQEMTIPLVNLRFFLADNTDIEAATKSKIWKIARSFFYLERSLPELLLACRKSGIEEKDLKILEAGLVNPDENQKRKDVHYAAQIILLKEGMM